MRTYFAITMTLLLAGNTALFAQNTKKETKGYRFVNKIVNDATPVKNQEYTGTCWSYCTTSFVESELMRMGKGEYDLSEMFTVRMIYQQKAWNYVRRQGTAQFGQGGLSHDMMNAIKEFGVVTEDAYPGITYDTFHNHSEMEAVLKAMLGAVVKNPNGHLTTAWPKAYSGVLDSYMGPVPEKFEINGTSYTPREFADHLGIVPDDYVEFTSFSHHPFYEKFILEVPDNWSNGTYYNLPLEELMAVIDHALANGFTIAWDADVSEKTWSRKHSIAIMPEIPYRQMTPEQRNALFVEMVKEMTPSQEARQIAFDNYETTDDHLMHIIGTAVDQNGNSYYLVKNSWGTNHNFDGYVYVSKAYMAMKTLGIMIHKDAVPKSTAKKIGL